MNFPSLLKSAVFLLLFFLFLLFFLGGGGGIYRRFAWLCKRETHNTSHSYSSTSQSDTPGILPHQCTTPILKDYLKIICIAFDERGRVIP